MSSSHSAAAPTQACTRTGTLVRKEDKQKPRSDPETKTCPVWCDADCKWQLIIYIVDTRPFIPKHPRMLSNTGSKTEGGVEEERWREAEHRDSGFLFFSFLFWSHPALRSHRRAGMNTKCSKFHHFHFIWETKIKPENKKSGYDGVVGGEGGSGERIHQIIPAHWRLSVPRGPSSPICAEYICTKDTSLNKTPSFLYTDAWRLRRTIHKTCSMTSICFSLCICNSPSVSSYS